ncbi:class I SAM-dependent methyltransferase [Corynebacterium sp. H78]|uniref:class I SAM-dependent methyltransferase n=1 Tax=Corynebacterium sp. H78 TaxID=3133417 RepID=UPI0030B54410
MPSPKEHPPIPPTSKRDNPLFRSAELRDTARFSFADQLKNSDDGALGYHSVRPGYPHEVLEMLSLTNLAGTHAVDVGAGTGQLTRQLLDAGATVNAIDPSTVMLDTLATTCPDARRFLGTAESMPMLDDDSADIITCAQTWHWVNVAEASAEFARVLSHDGVALLVWNTLDVRIPWVHRLTRIMHAGDVQKPGFLPEVVAPLRICEVLRTEWQQQLTPEQIVMLARTRSYWLNAKTQIREKVEANLRWYLYDHLGFAPGVCVDLPYRCDAFLLRPS